MKATISTNLLLTLRATRTTINRVPATRKTLHNLVTEHCHNLSDKLHARVYQLTHTLVFASQQVDTIIADFTTIDEHRSGERVTQK